MTDHYLNSLRDIIFSNDCLHVVRHVFFDQSELEFKITSFVFYNKTWLRGPTLIMNRSAITEMERRKIETGIKQRFQESLQIIFPDIKRRHLYFDNHTDGNTFYHFLEENKLNHFDIKLQNDTES